MSSSRRQRASRATAAARPAAARPASARRAPLVTSIGALRAIAAGITLLSLAGMTVYAEGHVRNASAPLQPPAPTAAPAVTTIGTLPTGRLQLGRGIATTSGRAVTTTHRS